MTFPLFHYTATVIRVVDGDTAWLRIDKGFHTFWEVSCRLFGVNAPELSTGAPGLASKDWLAQRLAPHVGPNGRPLYVVSAKLDKYGRPLVTLYADDPAVVDFKLSINQQMLDLKLAVPLAD